MPTATITSKGQLTLPKTIREQSGTHVGDRVDVSVGEDGTILLRRLGESVRDLAGIAKRPWHQPVSLQEIDESIRDFVTEADERTRSGP